MTLLETESYRYAIRIAANAVLEREIDHLLTRPMGRPSRKPKVFYHSFQYQVKSWHQPRRGLRASRWPVGSDCQWENRRGQLEFHTALS